MEEIEEVTIIISTMSNTPKAPTPKKGITKNINDIYDNVVNFTMME